MPRLIFLVLFLFSSTFTICAVAENESQLKLMPIPSSLQPGTGQFRIDSSFTVGTGTHDDARLRSAVELFLYNLRRQTGMGPLDMAVRSDSQASLVVEVEDGSRSVPELGEDESYDLGVTPSGAKLRAPTTLGAMRGLETFLQLVQVSADGFAVPAVTIHDVPRFPWRGLMIDVSRHFIPLDVLKRNLDGMAAVKLNVFHWHLSDDQGFRIESRRFPRLQQLGSDGLFYTQSEVRELISYAAERGIRVVPEFDMPGHCTSWFPAYPDLASGPGPYQIERKWGIFDPALNPADERTYKFLDRLIGEMAGLFPDKYFHIGGDELTGKDWAANRKIQAFMQAHGFKNKKDLQGYFDQRVHKIIRKHGKIMVGWDEILRPDLPQDVVVQAWHEESPATEGARQGHRSLLSTGFYLDLNWPASRHYAVDPLDGATLPPDQASRILGGEACMWSEYVSPENIDSRIWPRMAVIAERLWSPQNVTGASSMYQRLEAISGWLEWLGLTHNSSYEPMLRRLAGSNNTAALRDLADVVEPVKDYTREELAVVPATSLTPLNRLIDAARPESLTARHFAEWIDGMVSVSSSSENREQVRACLLKWQKNQVALAPVEAKSFLLKEAVPVSASLSGVAAIGLESMEYLDRGERAPDAWKIERLAWLRKAQEPQAQLLLAIVPSVTKLVEAAGASR